MRIRLLYFGIGIIILTSTILTFINDRSIFAKIISLLAFIGYLLLSIVSIKHESKNRKRNSLSK